VSFLKAKTVNEPDDIAVSSNNIQSFDFARNLIFFPALINGRPGNFILDTGAPTLLLNNHGKQSSKGQKVGPTGLAAGGAVDLTNELVESFQMGGEDHGRRWALALDLTPMEARMERSIDGFVGHDLLRGGELRIDYPNRTFQLLKSSRKPREQKKAPTVTYRFEYVDHLPVITLKVGKKKLRFAIDTGAGSNLIDSRHKKIFQPTADKINVQGLDGADAVHSVVVLPGLSGLDTVPDQLSFVSMDLSHLQTSGETVIDGILGSAFLANYCVGIDYRRRKLYLW
jgi:hypothetical protein